MSRRTINPDFLQIFLVFEKTRSMSETARELNFSESSVSRAIKTLETQLDVKLLRRDISPIMLTSAGRKLREHAKKVVDSVQALYDISIDLKKHMSLEINIASSTSFTRIFSPYVVSDLMREMKLVNAYTASSKDVCRMLLKNDVDIAIANEPMLNQQVVTALPLYQEDFLLVIPKSWEGEVRTSEGLRKLSEEIPFAHYCQSSTDYVYTSRILRQLGISPSVVSLDGIETMMKLIAENKVWALLPAVNIWAAEQYLSGVCFQSLRTQQSLREIFILYSNTAYADIAEQIKQCVYRTWQSIYLPKIRAKSTVLAGAIRQIK